MFVETVVGEEDGLQAYSQTQLGSSGRCEAVGLWHPETPNIHPLGRPGTGQVFCRCWDVVLGWTPER